MTVKWTDLAEYRTFFVLYCNSLLTKHVTHNINIMQNILKGHNKIKRLDRHDNNQIHK
jgi:hypothetical protein